jgi:hypothetical protein
LIFNPLKEETMKVVKVTLLFIVFICFSSVMGQVTVLFDKTFDGEATGANSRHSWIRVY